MQKPKNIGKIVTNVSFIAVALALAVLIGGRIFAQNQVIDVSYGDPDNTETVIAELNTDYVDSTSRTEDFFEGAKCNVANLDCFTASLQSSQVLGYTALLVGTPEGTESATTTTTGLLQSMGKILAWTYQPQASGAYYVADSLQNMGVISQAQAQGFGYYSLSPYLAMWRVFRNIAYIFFTVVIVVVGFLILFRQKVGGQAAVTAQQALPRIVLALILVTFSYAIAGFLIDLMYWIMYAFSKFLKFNNGMTAGDFVNGDFGMVLRTALLGNFNTIFKSVNDVTATLFTTLLPTSGILDWLKGLAGGLSGIIASLIIVIALVVNLFKLLFILLKSYALVLLNIIFAPLNLMLVAIPGTKNFQKWVMSIIANLSPFVITFFMMVIVGSVNSFFLDYKGTGTGFVPPYIIGGDNAGEAVTGSIGTIIALAVMLAMPEIVTNIKKKLGGEGGFFGEIANAATGNFNKARQSKAGKAVTGVAAAAPLAATRMIKGGVSKAVPRMGGGGSFWKNFGGGMIDSRHEAADAFRGGAEGGAVGAWKSYRAGNLSTPDKRKTYQQLLRRANALKTSGTRRQRGLANAWLNLYKTNYREWLAQGAQPIEH